MRQCYSENENSALIYIFQEGLIGVDQGVAQMHIVKESGITLDGKFKLPSSCLLCALLH
jgi:hypothetical protein